MSAVAVNVREDRVLANMKVMLEDLVLYQKLAVGPEQHYAASALTQAAEAHKQLLLQYFTVRDAAGQLVTGDIIRLDTSEIPAAGVPPADLMARNVFYHFAFPLAQRQEFLTIMQTFGGPEAVLPAIMELVVFQNGVLIQQPVELAQHHPHTVRLDWHNPPGHAAQSREGYQAWRQEGFRQQLGITSYSGLYSFLYITDYEVRHEILLPLLTLEKWLPLDRANAEFFDVAEQEAARHKIVAFFRDRNPLEIDGIPVKPVAQRLQFFGLDIKDFAQSAPPRQVSVYQARLGIILSYATKGMPSQVQVAWDTFNAYAPFLRSVVYAYDQEPRVFMFDKTQQRFVWTRPGIPSPALLGKVPEPPVVPMWSLPLISLAALCAALLWLGGALYRRNVLSWSQRLCGGLLFVLLGGVCWPLGRLQMPSPFAAAPAMSHTAAQELAATLLRNIYRAFDYQQESDVYDVLAQSVDGRLLAELYLQISNGLRLQEQGGAVARVQAVTLGEDAMVTSQAQRQGLPRFTLQCRWQVTGTVEHWGHIHTRVNEYEARLSIGATAGTWKITGYDVLNEQRLRYDTAVRAVKRAS